MNGVPVVMRNDWSSIPVPPLGQWRPTLSVSVVIPAYACQDSLDLVLASLSRQTYPAELTEVVVVDDGSTPRLHLPAIRPENCRLIWAPDHTDGWGIASAFQVGVEQSTGQIIQRLDADMLVFPEHVEAHARWHHEIPYAVTLGSKRFVDTAPGASTWPSPGQVAAIASADELFDAETSKGHDYIDKLLAETDQLRAADHLVFRAHVGATVGLRRELFELAGGMNTALRRGSDTEIGYRLAQAGAVFIPELQARSWHLGWSAMMLGAEQLQRYSRPFLADHMPHPRWLRSSGGSNWAVPTVCAVVDATDRVLEEVRSTVDSLLRSNFADLRVDLVGPWSKLRHDRIAVLQDPMLELRLIEGTYRSDPRVRFIEHPPETAFPAPYLLQVPTSLALKASSLKQMIEELDTRRAGLLTVETEAGPMRLWRTSAMSRAKWIRPDQPAPTPATVVELHGEVAIPAEALGGTRPQQTVEVGGYRSLLKASKLVLGLSARRLDEKLRR